MCDSNVIQIILILVCKDFFENLLLFNLKSINLLSKRKNKPEVNRVFKLSKIEIRYLIMDVFCVESWAGFA